MDSWTSFNICCTTYLLNGTVIYIRSRGLDDERMQMNKIMTLIAALFIGLIGLAAPASATGNDDQPDSDNKKVTFCHYDGSNENGGSGKYSKLETSVAAFYNAGHIDHVNDIWEAFSYT